MALQRMLRTCQRLAEVGHGQDTFIATALHRAGATPQSVSHLMRAGTALAEEHAGRLSAASATICTRDFQTL